MNGKDNSPYSIETEEPKGPGSTAVCGSYLIPSLLIHNEAGAVCEFC